MNEKLLEVFEGEKEVVIYCGKNKIQEIIDSLPKTYGSYSFCRDGITVHLLDIEEMRSRDERRFQRYNSLLSETANLKSQEDNKGN